MKKVNTITANLIGLIKNNIHKQTEKMIYITVAGSFLYLVRFEVLKIPTNLLEALIGITFVVWILGIKEMKIKKIDYQILFSISLILLGVIISILSNEHYKIGFGIIKGWFVAPIIFGLVVYHKIDNPIKNSRLLSSIFISATIVSLISLFYYFIGDLTFDKRLRSFFLSPNHLAMYLAPGFLIGLFSLLKINNLTKKLYLIISILAIASSLYLTYSYATWVAIIVSLLIYIFFSNKHGLNSNHKRFLLITILIAITIFSIQKNDSKFQDLINLDKRSSLYSRLTIWKSSLKILSDNWLIGIGPGNFQETYLKYQKYFPPYLEWAVPQPHNLYLAFWLQGGLLGIIGFFWSIGYWTKKMIESIYFFKNPNQKKSTINLLAIMAYFLIVGLIDTPYWKNDLSLVFWMIFFSGLEISYRLNCSKTAK